MTLAPLLDAAFDRIEQIFDNTAAFDPKGVDRVVTISTNEYSLSLPELVSRPQIDISPSGLGTFPRIIEQQLLRNGETLGVIALLETRVRYVMSLLKGALQDYGQHFEIEVDKEIHDAYNDRVQDAHAKMIWTHKGMSNWYRNGNRRVVAPTPFRNAD